MVPVPVSVPVPMPLVLPVPLLEIVLVPVLAVQQVPVPPAALAGPAGRALPGPVPFPGKKEQKDFLVTSQGDAAGSLPAEGTEGETPGRAQYLEELLLAPVL